MLIVWIILCGRFTVEILICGFLVSAALYLFLWRSMGLTPRRELSCLKKLPLLLWLIQALFVEVFKANLSVIRWTYSKKETQPCIVRFQPPLKSTLLRVMLANCITLTPGTITGLLDHSGYAVHCLDKSLAVDLEKSRFVQILRKMEETQ